MKQKISSLLATSKSTDAFGLANAADFPPASLGGQQFAIVHTFVTSAAALGAGQVSGTEQTHSAVLGKAAVRLHLHDDLIGITNAAHSLVLLGNTAIGGKFLMPHSNGDQALLNSARAFANDAAAFSAALISIGLPADFIAHLNADITAFEGLITAKGTALADQAGDTGGLADAAHQAVIALHVLKTIVPNTYKNNPAKLAAWATASHVEKHTPVPHAKPTPPAK
ncbi:MAG: hypothetical protein WCH99_21750 [Verrucomicrobiota bacterium]